MNTKFEIQGWVEVGCLQDLPRAGGRVVRMGKDTIALFRTVDDQVFALHDRCPHRGGPLSQGMVCGHTVSCPLHGMVIDLETGNAVAPDEGRVSRYSVRIDGERIFLSCHELGGGNDVP